MFFRVKPLDINLALSTNFIVILKEYREKYGFA